ncbi:MAG: HD domain-containing phosphohydrolase [Solirubrobacteraceae bacterium]
MRRIPLLVLVLTAAAIIAVILLENNADANRRTEVRVGSLNQALTDLEAAPLRADPMVGGTSIPAAVRLEIERDEAALAQGLVGPDRVPASATSLATAKLELQSIDATVAEIYRIASRPVGVDGDKRIRALEISFSTRAARLFAVLKRIAHDDAERAQRSRLEAAFLIVLAMLALFGVLLIFYVRSVRARRENEKLLDASRVEASTDALTGLGNRRALTEELAAGLSSVETDPELLLAMFDLNGFKQYNDTFGHGAGDALLARLGERLAAVVSSSGSAYRIGGDEFCVLARRTPQAAEGLLAAAAAALGDAGEGWSIDCSYGATWIPSEADTPSDALRNADRRMYSNKASRSSASRQLTDVLLRVLSEQDARLDVHAGHVAELAGRVADALGQPEHEMQRIRLAAQLHDVGETAIPGTVLNKPGPLDAHDWEFIHRHTLVGERIVLAAPALAHTATLIRSSHERIDGAGYPDGLASEQIPIGARIIAVCDAFDAMTSDRPYRAARTTEAALTELARCAGTQFDPKVVEAFSATVDHAGSHAQTSAQTQPGPDPRLAR